MGKKKKKNPNNSSESPISHSRQSHTPPRSTSSKNGDDRSSAKVTKFLPAVDYLQLSITSASPSFLSSSLSQASAFAQRHDPTMILSETDAERLGVSSRDKVFVLPNAAQQQEKPVLSSCSIVKVHIFKPENSMASPSTPTRESSPLIKDKQFVPGNAKLQPASFHDHLWRMTDSVIQDDMERPSTPSQSHATTPERTNNALATPSSSKSTFSFNSFVDQHNLSSPSPSASSRTIKTTPNRFNTIVIPLKNSLGKSLLDSALSVDPAGIFPATLISLEFADGLAKQSAPSKTHHLLECLVRAFHVGRFVQVGDPLSITFQGKTLDLVVSRVQHSESLEKDMSALTLEENDKLLSDNDSSTFEGHLCAAVKALRPSLHAISHQTKCVFEYPLQSSSEESSTFELPKQPSHFVAGLPKNVLENVREYLLRPLDKAASSSKASGGILLHGPSGVGKTCIAKEIASEGQRQGCHVESVNCVSLKAKTSIVGEAERALELYFRPVAKPKLLILDDVHLICSKRGGMSQLGTDQLAATLLALMDNVKGRSTEFPIAVLAITNDASALDPALRRPGRLDYEVEVPLPDEPTQRAEIMKHHLKRMSVDEISESELLAVAKDAKGFNGADCFLAVKEAVRASLRREKTANETVRVRIDDLEAAIKTVRPSAIKAVTLEIPQVHWSDIGGMDDVKRDLREAIETPLEKFALFQKLKIPPPRGVLLYGPPGTGKTMIARALATEGKMNFLAVKGPELLSKWLGESERALAALFRRARMASPCIIFFDEIDAIATKRGSSDSSSGSRMLSQLLTELDGVVTTGSSNKGKVERVVVVGATNRPDLLDSALTRPGRIDRMVYVGLPDSLSRERVFQVALEKRNCADDIDLKEVASDRVSSGFSGAELVSICREAALLALDECLHGNSNADASTPCIRQRHLLKSIQSTKKQISPEMLDFYADFRQNAAR